MVDLRSAGIDSLDQFLARFTLEYDHYRLRLSYPVDERTQANFGVGKLFVLTFQKPIRIERIFRDIDPMVSFIVFSSP